MSTQSDSDFTSIILFFQETSINEYGGAGRIALYIFDWILNLDREVPLFWKYPRNTAAFLYFGMRWTSLISDGLALASMPVTSPNTCNVMVLVNFAFACSQLLPRSLFFTVRTYGLLQNIYIASLILFLTLVPLGLNLSTVGTGIGVQGEIIPFFGCLQVTSVQPRAWVTGRDLTIAICTMLANIFLIAITWWITPRRGLIPDLTLIRKKSLGDVMYREGLVYFVLLLIMDIPNILVVILPFLNVTLVASGPLVLVVNLMSFIEPLSSILIAHFLLDLQEASTRTLKLDSDNPPYSETSVAGNQQSSVNFARIVGSLGAVIDHRTSRDELSEEDE